MADNNFQYTPYGNEIPGIENPAREPGVYNSEAEALSHKPGDDYELQAYNGPLYKYKWVKKQSSTSSGRRRGNSRRRSTGTSTRTILTNEANNVAKSEEELLANRDTNIDENDKIIVDDFLLNAKRGLSKNDDYDLKIAGEDTGYDVDNGEDLITIARYPLNDGPQSNYINIRNNWIKQIDPFTGKGFFYFKIFFNFDTNYGLLGNGIWGQNVNNGNTALQYLDFCSKLDLYKSESLSNRKKALSDFIESLYSISELNPWFFKEISGLGNLKSSFIDSEDFKENTITITCGEESTDTRLGTLFDLYKYACYDNIRNKEIIPSNLRKFEMRIMFFHIPLRKYHMAFDGVENDGSINHYPNKQIAVGTKSNDGTVKNSVSFKMFTFQNCEFDVNSMNEFNDSISNENIFELGKNQIRIKYDRVYENRYNEFKRVLIGQDLFKIYSESEIDNRLNAIANLIDSQLSSYKSEHNVYENGNIYSNQTTIHGKYYLDKLKYLKDGTISAGNIYNYNFGKGTNYFAEKLKRIKSGTIKGNLYDFDYIRIMKRGERVNTDYFENKLKLLKDGNIVGNLYGYKFSFFTNNGIKYNTKYLETKLYLIKEGNISGNLYDYNYGPDSDYWKDKMKSIQNGRIAGNIYDYDLGPGTNYWNDKMDSLNDGLIMFNELNIERGKKNEFNEKGKPYIVPKELGIPNQYKELNTTTLNINLAEESNFRTKINAGSDNYLTNINKLLQSSVNTFNENNIESKEIPIGLAKENSFKLDWNAAALRNSNNMYATDGNPSTKTTWLGKLGEATWQRTKNSLGF